MTVAFRNPRNSSNTYNTYNTDSPYGNGTGSGTATSGATNTIYVTCYDSTSAYYPLLVEETEFDPPPEPHVAWEEDHSVLRGRRRSPYQPANRAYCVHRGVTRERRSYGRAS